MKTGEGQSFGRLVIKGRQTHGDMLRHCLRLHLGCGLIAPDGWINIDGSWNARLAQFPIVRQVLGASRVIPGSPAAIRWNTSVRYHDLTRPLPFADGSASAIYSSHLFEHLYADDAVRLFGECFRVLAPGGTMRAVVPDLKSLVLQYTGQLQSSGNGAHGRSAADRFNERLMMRSWNKPTGSLIYRVYSSTKDFHTHKWMYDAESLSMRFTDAGFVNVEEMKFLESAIEGIEAVEKPERVLNGEGICVEGSRP